MLNIELDQANTVAIYTNIYGLYIYILLNNKIF